MCAFAETVRSDRGGKGTTGQTMFTQLQPKCRRTTVEGLFTRVRSSAVVTMAAYGGHAAVADLGLQIFVTLRKGKIWPPAACDIRIRYDQTIGDVKVAVAEKMGVPVEEQQLFHHKKELTADYDSKTLLEMNMHTGFALKGYDLTETPDYWPPVKQTDAGLVEEDA